VELEESTDQSQYSAKGESQKEAFILESFYGSLEPRGPLSA